MSNTDIIEEINKALFAHGAWKMRLRGAIGKGSSELTPEEAKCDDCCAFGKWLHGTAIEPELRAGKPHQVIVRLHKQFHQSAGKVLEAAIEDNRDGAISLLKGEFGDCSQSLIIALTKWKRELSTGRKAA